MALPLWNSKTAHTRLDHVSILMMGCLGDLWEWTFFKHQHSPSVPQITMLMTWESRHFLKKYSNLLPITRIRSHSTIANGDIHHSFHSGQSWWSHLCHRQRGQRSLIAIVWTSHVHNCNRTGGPCVLHICSVLFKHALLFRTLVRDAPSRHNLLQARLPHQDVGPLCVTRHNKD